MNLILLFLPLTIVAAQYLFAGAQECERGEECF